MKKKTTICSKAEWEAMGNKLIPAQKKSDIAKTIEGYISKLKKELDVEIAQIKKETIDKLMSELLPELETQIKRMAKKKIAKIETEENTPRKIKKLVRK